ncbi:ring-1,2-phenylacetyl-CoA epoxidase subunit PaaA [Melghirimyces profundicolus]|uniref:Ring-1,2-phenylacetyl-CoA epoxidase subunit PaaA n=1 Tax=Melghirimyces profundicolus TaxID=1242148 RepID=A0A2T6C4S8_9BACL|nr:1,2-phenylacetyl-CoA epoxidase subunit PaaA [Melghirimyces profundicolus]PTX63331.1 ring-1,2-phenylacetyl-CoA epoxidase subunit PaaA [Melghirimyces profundicolus]
MNHDERHDRFMERLERGEKIEATDWMPDEYRRLLLKLIHMHAVSEIMGAFPEKEWVPKAPTLKRKLAIMAKVQDEMGHGQLLLRVAEDLAAPLGKTREDLIDDLIEGRVKFHNVFHMGSPTWADAGVIGWLVDGAAIINQAALLDTSYGPYARVLKRICAEESFHMQHGENIILALAGGTKEQKRMLQEAVNRWWEPLIFFFGPVEVTPAAQRMIDYKIRTKTNEELRQQFFNKYIPRIRSLGLTIPDPDLRCDEKEGKWIFTEPDWKKFGEIVRFNRGPKSQERIGLRRFAHEEQRWVREALVRSREKQPV